MTQTSKMEVGRFIEDQMVIEKVKFYKEHGLGEDYSDDELHHHAEMDVRGDYTKRSNLLEKVESSIVFERKAKEGSLCCPSGYTWTKQDWGHREFDFYRCEGGHHMAYFVKEDLGLGTVKLPNGDIAFGIPNDTDVPDDTPID